MAELNIETFNEELFKTLEEQTPEAKAMIIEAEIDLAMNYFMTEVCELLDELVAKGYKSDAFTRVDTIKDNAIALLEEHERLLKQLKDVRRELTE